MTAVLNNVLESIGDTPLVKINRLFSEFEGVTVLGKLELMNPGGSMKDRIGLHMIEAAEAEGRIKPGDTLVEPTSGNTGLGLAMASIDSRCVKLLMFVVTSRSPARKNSPY